MWPAAALELPTCPLQQLQLAVVQSLQQPEPAGAPCLLLQPLEHRQLQRLNHPTALLCRCMPCCAASVSVHAQGLGWQSGSTCLNVRLWAPRRGQVRLGLLVSWTLQPASLQAWGQATRQLALQYQVLWTPVSLALQTARWVIPHQMLQVLQKPAPAMLQRAAQALGAPLQPDPAASHQAVPQLRFLAHPACPLPEGAPPPHEHHQLTC